MTMTEQKRKQVSFVENYGLARLLGASITQALDLCDAHPEQSVQLYSALLVARQAQASAGDRISAYSSLASALPVVGSVIAAAGGLLGSFANWLNSKTGASCDRSCAAPEASTRKRRIGLTPGFQNPIFDVLPFALHDGLVVDGPGVVGTPDQMGKLRGAGPLYTLADGRKAESRSFNNVRLRANPFYGLPSLVKGDWDRPWDTPGTYYGRAWQVLSVMAWMQDKLPCPLLDCLYYIMESVLYAPESAFAGTATGWFESKQRIPGLEVDAFHSPATDLCRRKGSRWYASFWMLHRDVGVLAMGLPEGEVRSLLQAVGGSSRFMDGIALAKSGTAPKQFSPWPWWYGTMWLSYDQLRAMLPKLDEKNRALATPLQLHSVAQTIRSLGPLTRIQQPSQPVQQPSQQDQQQAGSMLPILIGAGALAALLFWRR